MNTIEEMFEELKPDPFANNPNIPDGSWAARTRFTYTTPTRRLTMFEHRSWKTTSASLSAIIVAILTLAVIPISDNDPATLPNYELMVTTVLAAASGLWARDNDKSSEQVGADKQ
jgi:hypothetical protein